ncbi:MAG: EF-P beta-lysylation protein EpmB [Bacterioplanes sp.]|nr:EF-P beta-lysylation protein EpmB [Bacterioplanes sp.]
MRIITRTTPSVDTENWQNTLATAFRHSDDLLAYLELPQNNPMAHQQAAKSFPLLVPKPFADLMEKGNANDPLLRQVMTHPEETRHIEGFVTDPLDEQQSNVQPGIIHKYQGRVLLIAATGCAVNCRYCFRRHFAYQDNQIGRKHWQDALSYVRNDRTIHEVILSGGDPLLLNDHLLSDLLDHIESIPHIKRVRIHTRLPVVIPARLTSALVTRLGQSPLQCSMVLHVNHANELSQELQQGLQQLHQQGIILLNQSVLLRGINDQLIHLSELSELLFEFRVIPYYLHLLDPVQGAHHFHVEEQEAIALHRQLLANLPGYLVPKLVREVPGKANKSPIDLDL